MENPPKIFGHRGACDATAGVTENTVAAYRLARELGADGVELDVRLVADDSLLLHHDPSLSDGRSVADLTMADRPDSMPTLTEALDALEGLTVNIEIKNIPTEDAFDPTCRVADLMVAELAKRNWRDRVLVSSFHPPTVDRVRALDPDVPTAVLSGLQLTAADSIELAVAGGHDAIHPHVAFVTPELVAAAHDVGLAVNVWTVNDPDVIAELAGIGVDGIVTDDVLTALAAVDRIEPATEPG